MFRISRRSLLEAIILVTTFHHRICLKLDVQVSDAVPYQKQTRCEQMCSLIKGERCCVGNCDESFDMYGMLYISTDIPTENPDLVNCSSFNKAELFSLEKSQSNNDTWKALSSYSGYRLKCSMTTTSAKECKNNKLKWLFRYCVPSLRDRWEWTRCEPDDDYCTRAQENWPTATMSTITTEKSFDTSPIIKPETTETIQADAESQWKVLALALGIGLGLALLLFIIATVVLCVLLSRERRLKIVQRTHYSTLTPRPTANSDPIATDSTGSTGYETVAPVSGKILPTTKPSTSKNSPVYEEPSTIKPASTNNTRKWPKAPSVVYAMVNKLKPNRGVNKRTLASNSDDVIIVDNDLYTVESSPTGANGGFISSSAENSGSRSAYYSAAHPVDEASYAEVPQNGVRY